MSALTARSRLLGAMALSVPVAVCASLLPALAGFAAGLASLSLGERKWGRLAKNLSLVNVFFVGILATVPLAAHGDSLFTLGPLSYTKQGLNTALLMTVKGNAVFLILWGLVRPLDPSRLGAALSRLGVPDKLCLILSLTYRYLDLMSQEWNRLLTSAKLRGFTPGKSPRTFRTYGLLLALLIMRALDRSQAIHQAMACRGFTGRFVSLGGNEWTFFDTLLCAACLGAACTVVTLELI